MNGIKMPSKLSKLKPCPFCGRDDALRIAVYSGQNGFRYRFAVRCDYEAGGCGAEGGWRHSEFEAVCVWDERHRKKRGES